VGACYNYGLILGRAATGEDTANGGTFFDSDAPITRQEALWVLECACRLANLDKVSGLMNDGRYADKLTRAEAATMVLRVLQKSDLVDIRTAV
jgi:hypothetical protein